MNDVVGDARVVRLLLENGLENFAALALVRESFVGLGRGDVERQRVKDRCFAVVGIAGLQRAEFLFKGAGMGRYVLVIFAIDFPERLDVSLLARRRVCGCSAPVDWPSATPRVRMRGRCFPRARGSTSWRRPTRPSRIADHLLPPLRTPGATLRIERNGAGQRSG